jgi:RHS repeat-associated protein
VLTEHNDASGLLSAVGDPSRFFVPFGQRDSVTGSDLYHEFTGKPWDSDAKVYYFPYSPIMNQWTMADPLGLIDGPNMHAYVRRNPVKCKDILGLWTSFYVLVVCILDVT